MSDITWVEPGSFQAESHYYPRVPNARLHPLVRTFMRLSNERIALRYCHLNPMADPASVMKMLSTPTKYFRWAGADLFHVADDRGSRYNVVIETNSSPSGQKSMPLLDDHDEAGGYKRLLERSFIPMLKRRTIPSDGKLAVLYDKNEMETTAYAAVLADLAQEDVALIHFPRGSSVVTGHEGAPLVITETGQSIRAAFRYVTQQPWTRIPPMTKTAMLNPVLACLAGGRNKALAAKAYDMFNAAHRPTGLAVRTPETIWGVSHQEVGMWVQRMGGVAVVKNPYSNAGQGVWTITTPTELEAFMALEHAYDKFIVQGLIGNLNWTSQTRTGRLYHVGTVPDPKGQIFVADLRCMVGVSPEGFYPVSLYARRAPEPLARDLHPGMNSWSMLGTNLSRKMENGEFTTEPTRLMLMDERDFNRLGLGLDDLVEGYIQTVLSVHAIDEMACQLMNKKGRFRQRLFNELTNDPALAQEILT